MSSWRGFILGLLMVGCGPKEAAPGDTESTGSTGGGGSSASGMPTTSGGSSAGISGEVTSEASATVPMTSGEATTVDDGSTGSTTTTGFIPIPDMPPDAEDCDGFGMPNQSCPEGQKCTVEGEVGNTHCVDVVDEPKGLYEPCQILMGDHLSGYDDCGPGMLCWNVDAQTGTGICIGMCIGPPEALGCEDPAASCSICQECAIGLCLQPCDPLGQDCEEGESCLPNPQDPQRFSCIIDASGEEGQVFDGCEYVNTCDPGLVCMPKEYAAECTEANCCLPYCDTTAMAMCPGAGQECIPWYEGGMAPEGNEDVGICGVPQ